MRLFLLALWPVVLGVVMGCAGTDADDDGSDADADADVDTDVDVDADTDTDTDTASGTGTGTGTGSDDGTCGNAIPEGDEECDDGNATNSDACTTFCRNARCGDAIIWSGVEPCDDGDDDNDDECVDECVAATCGDGYTWEGEEQCDEGPDGGDGCSADCRCGDAADECTGNDSCEEAQGPYVDSIAVAGTYDDEFDEDWYTIELSTAGDFEVWTNDLTGDGCGYNGSGSDTILTLYESDCETEIRYDDDDRVGNTLCSRLRVSLAAGTYVLKVSAWSVDTGSLGYEIEGGIVTGSCGDGWVDSGEECDDGATVSGDGCDSGCTLEATTAEVEANDSCGASAQGPYTDSLLLGGTFSDLYDDDWYEIVLSTAGDLEVWTNDPTEGLCGLVYRGDDGSDTYLELYEDDCSTWVADSYDVDETTACSRISATGLSAGTYYVHVGVSTLGDDSSYLLVVSR